ncbi:hypothetical protein HYE36_05950 [Mycoplasmopsis bovis]|nr:hypothetical protein [Mycoplasmopsis bovis]WHL49564.1 hypothetical protein HYE36_05950 [Mycoplasmopsis bovis]
MLLEDTNGGKNKIKLKLGSYTFEVSLGKVYKDKVVTKYAINDSNSTIKISSDNKFDDINNTDDKIFVKQIGYSIDSSKTESPFQQCQKILLKFQNIFLWKLKV